MGGRSFEVAARMWLGAALWLSLVIAARMSVVLAAGGTFTLGGGRGDGEHRQHESEPGRGREHARPAVRAVAASRCVNLGDVWAPRFQQL